MKPSFFKPTTNKLSSNNSSDELQKWVQAINTLIETITDPNFETKYPGSTKKDMIDFAFGRGNLRTMSESPREELRSKLYSIK